MEIKVDHVEKRIRRAIVLNNISLKMESGKIYGFQGENGSGKTMLLRMVCGLIRPTKGAVYVDGRRLGASIDFPQYTGALIENPVFLDQYTGLQNLQLLAELQKLVGDGEIREALLRVGLTPDDKRKYRKYSLGMKQKLGIAAAIMERPELLVLDEPFNALDGKSSQKVKKIIREEKERGALVVLACHDKQMLERLCDVIIVMEQGRIAAVRTGQPVYPPPENSLLY